MYSYNDFIDNDKAKDYFNHLWNNLEWLRLTRRREYWVNDGKKDYSYGIPEFSRTYSSQSEDSVINEIRDRIEKEYGIYFNACFLNGYETNKDCLSWHSDDSDGIDHSKPIAIVSLYDGDVDVSQNQQRTVLKARSIQFMPIGGSASDIVDVPLLNGSLVMMEPNCQFTHRHQIPKAGFVCRKRISLTFRSLK